MAIPELFETILLGLPTCDLLINAQRVCKDWRTGIKFSKRLQQALFFEPLPGSSLIWLTEDGLDGEASNLREGWIKADEIVHSTEFTYWPDGEIDDTLETMDYTRCKYYDDEIAANPFIERIAADWQRWTARTLDGRLFAREASWRRMLVSQPPVNDVELAFWGCNPNTGKLSWSSEHDEMQLAFEPPLVVEHKNQRVRLGPTMVARHYWGQRDTHLYFPIASSKWKLLKTAGDIFDIASIEKRCEWEKCLDIQGRWIGSE